MNKDKFVEMLGSASSTIDTEYMDKVMTDAQRCIPYEYNQLGTLNIIVVMEELAELQQELSKAIRGTGDPISIIEELADNYIGIKHVQKIFGISDEMLARAVNVKLNRQDERNISENEDII